MAAIRFACPGCGARLKSTGEPGGMVDCPKCDAPVTIPEDEAVQETDPIEADEKTSAEEPFRIKAPWEYAKEWARVRYALLLCTIAAGLTLFELITREITDRLYRRAYSPLELYLGLAAGLLIGGFRIYAKLGFRNVPKQWGPRPLLWVCVGVEGALLIAITVTTLILARTPPPAEEEGPKLPPELTRGLSQREINELRREVAKQTRELRNLHSGTPVQRDPYVRVTSLGFGLSVLLAGLISILWPIYLKELAESIKDDDAWDIGDRVLNVLGPMFLLWVLSVSIYQFMASVTEVSGLYRPQGKSVTVLGLLTIQILLIRVYWRLRMSLRAKSRLKKPKPKPVAAKQKS